MSSDFVLDVLVIGNVRIYADGVELANYFNNVTHPVVIPKRTRLLAFILRSTSTAGGMKYILYDRHSRIFDVSDTSSRCTEGVATNESEGKSRVVVGIMTHLFALEFIDSII